MKWPYVIKMPVIGKFREENNGQYSITVGRFLNVDHFIRFEIAVFVYNSCATVRFAIVLTNFTTNE